MKTHAKMVRNAYYHDLIVLAKLLFFRRILVQVVENGNESRIVSAIDYFSYIKTFIVFVFLSKNRNSCYL